MEQQQQQPPVSFYAKVLFMRQMPNVNCTKKTFFVQDFLHRLMAARFAVRNAGCMRLLARSLSCMHASLRRWQQKAWKKERRRGRGIYYAWPRKKNCLPESQSQLVLRSKPQRICGWQNLWFLFSGRLRIPRESSTCAWNRIFVI